MRLRFGSCLTSIAQRRSRHGLSAGSSPQGYSHPGFVAWCGAIGTWLMRRVRSSATNASAAGDARNARGHATATGRASAMFGRLCMAALHGRGE